MAVNEWKLKQNACFRCILTEDGTLVDYTDQRNDPKKMTAVAALTQIHLVRTTTNTDKVKDLALIVLTVPLPH